MGVKVSEIKYHITTTNEFGDELCSENHDSLQSLIERLPEIRDWSKRKIEAAKNIRLKKMNRFLNMTTDYDKARDEMTKAMKEITTKKYLKVEQRNRLWDAIEDTLTDMEDEEIGFS